MRLKKNDTQAYLLEPIFQRRMSLRPRTGLLHGFKTSGQSNQHSY